MPIPAIAVLAAVGIGAYVLTRKKKNGKNGNGNGNGVRRFDWGPILAEYEGKFPAGTTVTRLSSGYQIDPENNDCFWAVSAVDPPPPGGQPYLGVITCPATGAGAPFWDTNVQNAENRAIEAIRTGSPP